MCRRPLAALLLIGALPAMAQDDTPGICGLLDNDSVERLACEGFAKRNQSSAGEDVKEQLRETLESPAVLNKIVNDYLVEDHGWQFLRDINFAIKAFDADGSGDTPLGFSYDYGKTITDHALACSTAACLRGLDLSFSATGNVAFDSNLNPRDFLDTSFSFAWYQSRGGVQRPTPEQQSAINAGVMRFQMAATDEEEAAVQALIGQVRETFTPQLYLSVAANGALESDQSFDHKQYVWSAQAALDFKDWTNVSAWSKFNIIDFPAALIRAGTGYDECGTCFRPRGTAWPTLRVALGQVSPEDDDPRALAGDSSDFTRAEVELAYRSPIARLDGDRIYLSASWRYYRELDPLASVEAAGLDVQALTTVIIGGTNGVFLSFSEGKLPFGVENEQVVELGFRFQL